MNRFEILYVYWAPRTSRVIYKNRKTGEIIAGPYGYKGGVRYNKTKGYYKSERELDGALIDFWESIGVNAYELAVRYYEIDRERVNKSNRDDNYRRHRNALNSYRKVIWDCSLLVIMGIYDRVKDRNEALKFDKFDWVVYMKETKRYAERKEKFDDLVKKKNSGLIDKQEYDLKLQELIDETFDMTGEKLGHSWVDFTWFEMESIHPGRVTGDLVP